MPRYQHDPYTNMMAHGTPTTAGANLLPFRYKDSSIITVPINVTALPDDGSNPRSDSLPLPVTPTPEKKAGFFRRFSAGGRNEKDKLDIKAVKMTRGEYLKYWAKDEKGVYRAGVVEPPGGRREWVRKQVELNEGWKRGGK